MKNIKMLLSGLVLVMSISLVGCTDSTNNTGRDISVPKSEDQLNEEKEEKIYAAYGYMIDDFMDVTFADVIEYTIDCVLNGDSSKVMSECDGNKVTISLDSIDGKPYGYVFTFNVNNNKAELDNIKFIDENGNEEIFDDDRVEWELFNLYDAAYAHIIEKETSTDNSEITEETKTSVVEICNKFNSQSNNIKLSYYEKSKCILVKYIIQDTSYQDIQNTKSMMGQQEYKQFILNVFKTGNEQQEIQNIKNEVYELTGVNIGVEVQVVPELNQTMVVAFYRESTGWMVM